MCQIRLLEASEIDVRIQSVNDAKKFAILLLYKDARCDMRILDETFGVMGWQRSHELINGNLFCTVSIYNKEINTWVHKQDVGTESNTEKEKGEASDSFKRACFNVGIGRELYTAPSIFITINEGENIKYTKFHVKEIAYNDKREISKLIIADASNKVRFSYPKTSNNSTPLQDKKEDDTDLLIAKQEASQAKTMEELQEVWNRWKSLHQNDQFKREVNRNKVKFQKQTV
ncbi:hypothetical protein [Paludibacter sp. 221]|uniref:hypothetical protein n=1 Tax=Paludibacter sp. 221 TaxID=2302939 RepID=UPI0019439B5E|nr:hypothetical protein [Paludibacter sp. 221]